MTQCTSIFLNKSKINIIKNKWDKMIYRLYTIKFQQHFLEQKNKGF